MAPYRNLPESFEDKVAAPNARPETETISTQEQFTKPPSPEGGVEVLPGKEQESFQEVSKEDKGAIENSINILKNKLKRKKVKPNKIPQVRDELTLRIEKIMEEDLGDAYQELTPIQKQEFKIKGEEVAWKIRQLLKSTHVKIKQIFKLLAEWLKLLPGINKFFLEQEAKIKADKIISLKKFH